MGRSQRRPKVTGKCNLTAFSLCGPAGLMAPSTCYWYRSGMRVRWLHFVAQWLQQQRKRGRVLSAAGIVAAVVALKAERQSPSTRRRLPLAISVRTMSSGRQAKPNPSSALVKIWRILLKVSRPSTCTFKAWRFF
jgi:hypothetical protein